MPVEFLCPHCGREYKVADSNVGKAFRCKQCTQPITVPAAVVADDAPLQFVEAEPETAPAPPPLHTPPPGAVLPLPRAGMRITDRVAGHAVPAPAPAPYQSPPHAHYAPQPVYKPLSVKALLGLIFAFLGPLCLVGVVLSFMGLQESGPRGRVRGYGMAVAGVILNLLMIGVGLAGLVLFVAAEEGLKDSKQQVSREIEEDFKLIRKRLQAYYVANNNLLTSGGPAQAPSRAGTPVVAVNVAELVDPSELGYARLVGKRSADVFGVEVTGPNSARIICFHFVELARMEITDVSEGISTIEWPNR